VFDPLVLRDDAGVPFTGTFRDAGRSTGVVVVPGFTGWRRLREIDAIANRLALEHDVLSIDVRGHGDTPGRFTWGREEWRQVVGAARFLAVGGRRVAAVGFSMGGYHALRAAAREALFERIAVVGAPADLAVLDLDLGRRLRRHLPIMLSRRRRFFRCELPPRPSRSTLSDAELEAVGAEVLVIHGEGDFLVRRRHAERIVAALRQARLVEIEGGLHAEYLVRSHPNELFDNLTEFLGRGTSPESANSRQL
jgi:pimeloyl-ACP methyl ester carboxylesterase